MLREIPETLKLLLELYPLCFHTQPSAVRPLKIGIHQDLIEGLGEDMEADIREALRCYTRLPSYQRALGLYRVRFGLDGLPAGEVSDRQQEAGRVNWVKWKARAKARKEAAKAKPPASQPVPAPDTKPAEFVPPISTRPVLKLRKALPIQGAA